MQSQAKTSSHSFFRSQLGQNLLTILILMAILAAGMYLRNVGTDWDAGRHLHPDERFLSMVESSIRPLESFSDYFNTAKSSLNPNNVGYSFFVYGTFPIFLIRYVGEWLGQTGYDLITIVGRQMSAMADGITILLVFLIAWRLYGRKLGLIGAAFYAFAVLPIQQAHFMTVDTFANTFAMLTVFIAVLILKSEWSWAGDEHWLLRAGDYLLYLAFGLLLGMAAASKINTVVLALLLPLVVGVRLFALTPEKRRGALLPSLALLTLAGLVSFLSFRVLQPYAFSGPSFFNMKINPDWWSGLLSLKAQSTGNIDFPPALQWARRETFFSIKNLLLWGLGLPLGLSAFGGLVWMGWKIFKRHEYEHFPLWAWTLFYTAWQGFAWVKAMRYLLPVYPLLAIFSAWGLVAWITRGQDLKLKKMIIPAKVLRTGATLLTALLLLGTGAWAWSFSRIYTRPHSRVQATDWIYENIPGPVNLQMSTEAGNFSQPLPYRSTHQLEFAEAYTSAFTVEEDGWLQAINFPSVMIVDGGTAEYALRILDASGKAYTASETITKGASGGVEAQASDPGLSFALKGDLQLKAGERYLVELSVLDHSSPSLLTGVPNLTILNKEGRSLKQSLNKVVEQISPWHSYEMGLSPQKAGEINALELPMLMDSSLSKGQKTLRFTLSESTPAGEEVAVGELEGDFLDGGAFGKGSAYTVTLDHALKVEAYESLRLTVAVVKGYGHLDIASFAPVHESSWDDALPVSKEGYVPYSDNGGIFRGDLNLELYWPDDESKRGRMIDLLNQGDYIFISSNRQWGTIPRVPERYPLSEAYYRNLLACPAGEDIVSCYNRAEPGLYQGLLGFELVKTVSSYPNLGSLQFNDQFAEEAFSVYDHPKVLIFKKTADYSSANTRAVLEAVDLSKAVFLTPRQADTYDAKKVLGEDALSLSPELLQEQQANGSWSELFDRQSLVNRYPALAVLALYGLVSLLGLALFPLFGYVFGGLKDKGFLFSKLGALLLLAWLALLWGSAGLSVSRGALLGIVLALVLGGLVLGFFRRAELQTFFKEQWKQVLLEEVVMILAFALFLWVRSQNPDLWHPWKGGEKPMDFSYLNAVLKSNTFPAYDPWFAGGYINYYYYGLIIVGMPIKLLGIIPAVAYNIILPLWYALLVGGAFCIGWNLTLTFQKTVVGEERKPSLFGAPFWGGIATGALLAFLGNLGEGVLLADGFALLGGWETGSTAGLFARLTAIFKGLSAFVKGAQLPIGAGNWYWNPSRAIPGEAITEFPAFTFLYADLHAHLIAMPITVMSVGWGLSFLLRKELFGRSRKQWLGLLAIFGVGALTIGALKPTNTWDFYTFLVLALCIVAYVAWRSLPELHIGKLHPRLSRVFLILLLLGFLGGLAMLMYQPFNAFFRPGYSQFALWKGDTTPLISYWTHWGFFIFIVVCWYAWETYEWMERTPMRFLRERPQLKKLVPVLAVLFVLVLGVLLLRGVRVAVIALPLCAWSLLLLLLPDQPDVKRLCWFMNGTAFLLTMVVELLSLVGDIGRMNIVFKLYLQAWVLLALANGVGLIKLWVEIPRWKPRWQLVFQVFLVCLLAVSLLFPIFGGFDKMTDRMQPNAPQGLDGMKYMQHATYNLNGFDLNLSEDYEAIRWMQDKVAGSPVILEGQTWEYQWGNRFTIYTGLPGVVGWNYHQRQQRAILRNESVQNRVNEVNAFYTQYSADEMKAFLQQYRVAYVVFGQLEVAVYSPEALQKFDALKGVLWDEVFRLNDTVIYKVR